MTTQEKQEIAKKVNGILGTGKLNWVTDFNRELKKEQFTIFFNKESKAKKAMLQLNEFNTRITNTPKFVNIYFKYGVTITL